MTDHADYSYELHVDQAADFDGDGTLDSADVYDDGTVTVAATDLDHDGYDDVAVVDVDGDGTFDYYVVADDAAGGHGDSADVVAPADTSSGYTVADGAVADSTAGLPSENYNELI